MSEAKKAILMNDAEKRAWFWAEVKGDLVRSLELLTFVSLSLEDLKRVGKLKSDDWMAYGAAREWEYFSNRDEESEAEGKAILTKEEWDIYKPYEDLRARHLTWDLYQKMSQAEDTE